MPKIKLYEAIQDERNKPKPAVKPIEQWDATELRRAMLADARRVKSTQHAINMRDATTTASTEAERNKAAINAMHEIGRPCTKHDLADVLGVTPHSAYSYMKPLIMADIVTTDREHNKAPIIYSLVEGYDGQSSLDI